MKKFALVVQKFFKEKSILHVLITGYCLITSVGTLVLCLPWSQKIQTPWLDHLFTAISAISTTGLATVSTSDTYTFFGQLVILLLIQIGGLGYMTFGSFVVLMGAKKVSFFQKNMMKTQFGLPDQIDLYAFIPLVTCYTLIVELIGAVFLYFIFRVHGVENPLWQAVFHSISAFCTAGFSLFNTSFENFYADPGLNIVISILSILGAIGFLIVLDVWTAIRSAHLRVSYSSKIILWFTALVVAAGTAIIFFTEPNIMHLSAADRFWISLFQCMSASTTVGFDTIPMSQLSSHIVYWLSILMVIGASPAGTGGGIKSTTVFAVWAQMASTFAGRPNVTFMNRNIPDYRLRWATTSFTFYITILCLGILFLVASENFGFFPLMFEAASALGTVGLSMGITSSLDIIGKWIIILLMFIGRIGPLSLGLAVFFTPSKAMYQVPDEDLVL